MQRELVLLQETITKQNEKITSLERKLGHLDSNIVGSLGITTCSCKPCDRCVTGKIGWPGTVLPPTIPGY